MRYSLVFTVTLLVLLSLVQISCNRTKRSSANDHDTKVAPAKIKPTVPPGLSPQAYMDLGNDAFKQEKFEQAAVAYEAAIKLEPTRAEAHYRLAMCYSALQRDEESSSEYKLAIENYNKQPDAGSNADVQFAIGKSYQQLRRYAEAAQYFRQTTRLQPEREEAFYALGFSHTKLAHYPEAIAALKRALELDPDDFQAAEVLETAQEGKQRIDDSVRLQKEAARNKNANANGNGNTGSNNSTNSSSKPKPPNTHEH